MIHVLLNYSYLLFLETRRKNVFNCVYFRLIIWPFNSPICTHLYTCRLSHRVSYRLRVVSLRRWFTLLTVIPSRDRFFFNRGAWTWRTVSAIIYANNPKISWISGFFERFLPRQRCLNTVNETNVKRALERAKSKRNSNIYK